MTPIPAGVAAKFGVPHGRYVEDVVPGGPTANASIQVGDIITEVAGQPATSFETLIALATKKRAGDTVKVTYVRNGTTSTTTVTLANQP